MKRCNKVLLLIVVLMVSCAAILCASAATTLSISSPAKYDLFSWEHKIMIKWNSVSGAAGYHVSVRKDGATDPCLYREWVTGTSYDISDSIPADPGKYKVWVGAVETQGAASPVDWQDSIEIYIAREPAVTNGDASAINDSGATLEMSVDRDYGYAIEDCGFYIGTSSTKSQMTKYSFKNYSTAQGATSKGTKYMEVTGLEAGKKYYYRAYAVNTVGEDYSESSYFFTTGGTPVTLSKPVITYPTNNSICQANKSIKLQWNAVSGVEKYYYYIKQLSGTPDTSNNNEPCVEEWTGSVSSSRKYYTLSATNVKAGYWYKFVVEASAEGAISGWSDWCYVYIGKGTLTKPVVTSLTNWSEVNPGNAIVVDWDDVDTAAGYRCHIKRLSGQPDTSDNNEPALQSWKPDCGTTSSYTLAASDVTGGYWYKFVVEAYDGGESTWSDWYYLYATETGKLDIPVITSPVVGDNCEAGKSIAFTWGKVENAEGYNYFIKELTGEPDYSDNESASKAWKGSTSATRRRFTLNGENVQPNTWYKFVVEAKAEGYQSGWSRYTYIKIPDRVDWVHYKLPPALLEIQDEMFSGNSELRTFDASDSNLMRIGSNAFAGCKNLLSINLPATVEYIADDAFTNCSSVVFHCVSGSYAESYAKGKGIQVEQHGIAVESDMIQISQTRWDPEGDAAQLNLDVTSSGNWKAKKSSNSSWLTLSATSGYSSGSITLKASKNTKSSKRTATITFTCGDATAKVEIEQKKAGSSGGSSGSTATPVVTGNWTDSPTIHVTLGDTHYLEGDINVTNGYLGVVSVSVYGGENQAVTKKYEGTKKTHIDNLGDELWIDTVNNTNFNKVGTYELTMYAKAEGSNEAVKIGSKTLVVEAAINNTITISVQDINNGIVFTNGSKSDTISNQMILKVSNTNGCGKYKVVVIALKEEPDFNNSNQYMNRDTNKFTDGYAYNDVLSENTYSSWENCYGGIPIDIGSLDEGQWLKIYIGAYANTNDSSPAAHINVGVVKKKPTNGPTTRKFQGIIWPLDKDYNYVITSLCGYRTDPITGQKGSGHQGMDISGYLINGKPIMAVADGIAYTYCYSTTSGYGRYIIIDHMNGFYTLYGHMSAFADGTKAIGGSKTVKQGEIIGYVGSSGKSTGPHLHFEIRYCKKGNGCVSEFLSVAKPNWHSYTWEVVDPYPTDVQNYKLCTAS